MARDLVPFDSRSGERLWARAIRGTDAAELQRAFAQLSDLSRYRRFLTGTPALSDRIADFLSDIDHVNHVALVALPSKHSQQIVGVARFIRYPHSPTEADLAITVADDWHGKGVATGLLGLLSERARAVGVQRFTVDMLADNMAVRALVKAAGGEEDAWEDDIVGAHIDIAPTTGAIPLRHIGASQRHPK